MRTASPSLTLSADEATALQRLKDLVASGADYGWNPDFRRDLLLLARTAGKPIARIARELGVTRQYLHAVAIRLGLKPGQLRAQRRQERLRETEQRTQEVDRKRETRLLKISKMWKADLPTAEMARRLKMEVRSVAVLVSTSRRERPDLFPVRNEGLSQTMARSWNRRTRRTARIAKSA